ncbi:MAG: hypothetical protein L6305_04010 [Actinomycetia bacterium]|nr:hypothetical protein [Actinomycetes bacterium]
MEERICTYNKETDNKYRWDAMVDNAPLEIYIPKWRVPDPYPQRISVQIFEPADSRCPIVTIHSKKEVKEKPGLRLGPITAEVTFTEVKELTVRYDPVLAGNDAREIGSPYIPKTLLDDPPQTRLVIVINWKTGNKAYHNSTY